MSANGTFFPGRMAGLQKSSEPLSSAIQPGSDGTGLAFGDFRDGLIVQPFLISKEKDGPIGGWQARQARLDVQPRVLGGFVGSRTFHRGGGFVGGPCVVPSPELERFVDRDPIKPGEPRGSPIELRESGERANVGFLCHLGRIVRVPRDSERESIDSVGRPGIDLLLGLAVPTEAARDDFRFDQFQFTQQRLISHTGPSRRSPANRLTAEPAVTSTTGEHDSSVPYPARCAAGFPGHGKI